MGLSLVGVDMEDGTGSGPGGDQTAEIWHTDSQTTQSLEPETVK